MTIRCTQKKMWIQKKMSRLNMHFQCDYRVNKNKKKKKNGLKMFRPRTRKEKSVQQQKKKRLQIE